MPNDPHARDREFRERIERAARERREARVRRGRWVRRPLLLLAVAVVLLPFVGLFVYIFGLHIKGTDAYACSLAEARRSPLVVAQLGEPIEAGFFAWTRGYSREMSVTDASFSTTLTGPKGSGTLRTRWYSSPIGSSLRLELEKDGQTHVVYSGVIPCR